MTHFGTGRSEFRGSKKCNALRMRGIEKGEEERVPLGHGTICKGFRWWKTRETWAVDTWLAGG